MYKGVIFDLDGTLLNTIDDITDSINHVLTNNNFPIRTLKEMKSFVGNGALDYVRKALPSNTDEKIVKKCFNKFKIYYKKHSNIKTNPYPGILDMLKTLSEKYIKIAIVSNKIDDEVKILNDKLFNNYVDIVIGERAGIALKPDPTSINEVIETMDLEKHEVIYVGDTEVDMLTAKNAQIDSIGVTWGFRNKNILISNGAKYIISTPSDIFKILF